MRKQIIATFIVVLIVISRFCWTTSLFTIIHCIFSGGEGSIIHCIFIEEEGPYRYITALLNTLGYSAANFNDYIFIRNHLYYMMVRYALRNANIQ